MGTLNLATLSGGKIGLVPTDTDTDKTISVPAASGNMVLDVGAQTLDAKTLTGTPSINGGAVSGLKEKIINGRMEIDQRNSGVSVNPAAATTTYLVDRFCAYVSQTSKLSFQQVTDGPSGFKNSLKVTVSSQYSPSSGEQFILWQPIEGLNCIDLALGTASASQITARVYAKSSVPGTYACWLTNGAANRTYVGTITLGTTWALNTILLTGDTTGTWATDNGQGLLFGIDLGSGTSLQTSAGAWQAGAFRRTSGSVTFVNQAAGSTLNITGVSLKAGDCRNELYNDWRPYSIEEMLCQRYLPTLPVMYAVNTAIGQAISSTTVVIPVSLKTIARVAPTGIQISAASNFQVKSAGAGPLTCTSLSFNSATTFDCALTAIVASGLTAGDASLFAGLGTDKIIFTGCEL